MSFQSLLDIDKMPQLINWNIQKNLISEIGVAVHGELRNHEFYDNGTNSWISTFISFDFNTKCGITRSGDRYQLINFKPNEIVSTEAEAIKMIQSWIK